MKFLKHLLISVFIIIFFSIPVFGRRIKGFNNYNNNLSQDLFETPVVNELFDLLNRFYSDENPELFNYFLSDEGLWGVLKSGRIPPEGYLKAVQMFMERFSYLGMIDTDIFKTIDPILKRGDVIGALFEYKSQVIDKILSDSGSVFRKEDLEKLAFSDLMALDFISSHLSNGDYQGFFEKAIKISAETEDGLDSYLKGQEYYKKFKEKATESGLGEDFDSPGKKFKVQYSASQEKVRAMEDIVQRIKYHLPTIGIEDVPYKLAGFLDEVKVDDSLTESFRAKWKEKIGDRDVGSLSQEESHQLISELMEITKTEMTNGDNSVDKFRVAGILITLAEFYYIDETTQMRDHLADEGLDLPQILKGTQQYWAKIGEILQGVLTGKIYNKYIAPVIKDKKQVQRLLLPVGEVEGELEFELTDRRIEDLMRGWIGGTCEKDIHFYDTLAHLIDPATLVFKIKEGGKFIGYMVSAVAKDSETGEAVLVIDSIQIRDGHPIASKSGVKKFVPQFLDELEKYAQSVGFKKIIFANQEWAISNKSESLGRGILSALGQKISQEPDSIFELVTPGSAEVKGRFPKLTAFTRAPTGEGLDEHLDDFGFPPAYYHYFQIYGGGGDFPPIDNNNLEPFQIDFDEILDPEILNNLPLQVVEDIEIFAGLIYDLEPFLVLPH
jgi:hypothetical protein